MYKKLLTLITVLFLTGNALSYDLSTKEPRWKQLSQAYGFVLGQQISLELIEKKIPDLAKDVRDARFAFNSSSLGECFNDVEQELAKTYASKWGKYKKEITNHLRNMLEGQNLTRQQSLSFLQEIHKRSKGEIPEIILATLLSAHPPFSSNPGLELSNGWKYTFRTKGHPKAKNVDFSISIPASWTKREGDRPNIIQVFHSGAGYGQIVCTLMVKNLMVPPTKDELKVFFHENEFKKMIPDGSAFVDAKEMVLEGLPAGMLVCDQIQKRLDIETPTRATQFLIVHNSSMILIQFMLAKMQNSNSTLDELQKQYLPTFKAIANTFILNDMYK